jgi:hypothetical protein
MIFEDLKKVSHYCTPQSWEGLPTDRDNLTLISLAVRKNDPKQDIKSFA